jgi:hypothetical protein
MLKQARRDSHAKVAVFGSAPRADEGPHWHWIALDEIRNPSDDLPSRVWLPSWGGARFSPKDGFSLRDRVLHGHRGAHAARGIGWKEGVIVAAVMVIVRLEVNRVLATIWPIPRSAIMIAWVVALGRPARLCPTPPRGITHRKNFQSGELRLGAARIGVVDCWLADSSQLQFISKTEPTVWRTLAQCSSCSP